MRFQSPAIPKGSTPPSSDFEHSDKDFGQLGRLLCRILLHRRLKHEPQLSGMKEKETRQKKKRNGGEMMKRRELPRTQIGYIQFEKLRCFEVEMCRCRMQPHRS